MRAFQLAAILAAFILPFETVAQVSSSSGGQGGSSTSASSSSSGGQQTSSSTSASGGGVSTSSGMSGGAPGPTSSGGGNPFQCGPYSSAVCHQGQFSSLGSPYVYVLPSKGVFRGYGSGAYAIPPGGTDLRTADTAMPATLARKYVSPLPGGSETADSALQPGTPLPLRASGNPGTETAYSALQRGTPTPVTNPNNPGTQTAYSAVSYRTRASVSNPANPGTAGAALRDITRCTIFQTYDAAGYAGGATQTVSCPNPPPASPLIAR